MAEYASRFHRDIFVITDGLFLSQNTHSVSPNCCSIDLSTGREKDP